MKLFPSEEKKVELLARLKLEGVSEVVVEFSGGGDSGEITDVEFYDAQNKHLKHIREEKIMWAVEEGYQTEDGEWNKRVTDVETNFCDVLTGICEKWLEETDHDWYNNEGGQGTMQIDFNKSPPEFCLNVGLNITKTDEYYYTLDEEEDE